MDKMSLEGMYGLFCSLITNWCCQPENAHVMNPSFLEAKANLKAPGERKLNADQEDNLRKSLAGKMSRDLNKDAANAQKPGGSSQPRLPTPYRETLSLKKNSEEQFVGTREQVPGILIPPFYVPPKHVNVIRNGNKAYTFPANTEKYSYEKPKQGPSFTQQVNDAINLGEWTKNGKQGPPPAPGTPLIAPVFHPGAAPASTAPPRRSPRESIKGRKQGHSESHARSGASSGGRSARS